MASNTDDRPKNPDYLIRAVQRIFGEACLRCGTDRPRAVMAHIRDWPKIREKADRQIWGTPLPPETVERLREKGVKLAEGTAPELTRVTYEHRYGLFHDLGNVLPLCPNCHALFDGKSYPEVTEEDIRALRDDAVRRPEVLTRVIAFIRAELRGRQGRCTHRDENGAKEHTHRTDMMALGAPLFWVANGYAAGLDLGEPTFIVECASKTQHHHAALDQGVIDLCLAPLRSCTEAARIQVPR
ncbi:hypothetical protein B6R96_36200 (plasmid) [Streptomyces sp. Sge12]|uniref:HNH endonuclease n=1 Tax=Streptomyces sp. Sge12 TaxID=1972846 RepID=UPI0009C1D80D|nr:HNH endonuclease [Streptomyces sp. Sge12]ARE79467.1 hypothetical protein B6R96_36200 [Streptomyces sp. Sge12]